MVRIYQLLTDLGLVVVSEFTLDRVQDTTGYQKVDRLLCGQPFELQDQIVQFSMDLGLEVVSEFVLDHVSDATGHWKVE